jgi:hypothetical protein
MEELSFKIVKTHGPHDEVVLQPSNFLNCQAAFEKALFVWPNEHLQMRQGARIILKSKERPKLVELGGPVVALRLGILYAWGGAHRKLRTKLPPRCGDFGASRQIRPLRKNKTPRPYGTSRGASQVAPCHFG